MEHKKECKRNMWVVVESAKSISKEVVGESIGSMLENNQI